MAKPRKLDNGETNMKVNWKDKDLMSCFKQKMNKVDYTRKRIRYESDAIVFNRIVVFFAKHNKPENSSPVATYPELKNTVKSG